MFTQYSDQPWGVLKAWASREHVNNRHLSEQVSTQMCAHLLTKASKSKGGEPRYTY